jgi:CBS domain containing-hemolysin-like protein
MEIILLVVIVVISLSFSFLCSILEAALLTVSTAELTERKTRGDKGAILMLEMKTEHLENSISAILTLNTIAHTIGATLAGAQAAKIWLDQGAAVFGFVLTILVLVATEIIPKTLGTVHASSLAGFVGRTIKILVFILKPMLFITHYLTSLVARGDKKPISRGELIAMVDMAHMDATLDPEERNILTNVLKFDDIPISTIMTPRTVVTMVDKNASLEVLIHDDAISAYSRVPVFEDDRDNITGYVLVRDILKAAATGRDLNTSIDSFVRDIWFLPEVVSVDDAMRQFLERHEPMAMVIDEHGAVAGLLTLEDVLETVLGAEITDETDHTVDLRQLALQLRDQRLDRLRASGRLAEFTDEVHPADEASVEEQKP